MSKAEQLDEQMDETEDLYPTCDQEERIFKGALTGKSFPWHSDFEAWYAEDGLPPCRVLSAWIMLTENHEFNGPLYLNLGSHQYFVCCADTTPGNRHKISLHKQAYDATSINVLQELAFQHSLAATHGTLGTLILHEGNTLHGSPDNISSAARTNLFFVYNNSVHHTPAEEPSAAARCRPELLSARDFTPLQAVNSEFARWH